MYVQLYRARSLSVLSSCWFPRISGQALGIAFPSIVDIHEWGWEQHG